MIYEGEFQSGTFHGQGTSYYDTGIKKYEGQFYMGREQGTGILYAPSGREVFEGVFEEMIFSMRHCWGRAWKMP